jgi:adenine-specific DNA-methyltransferase
MSHFDPLDMQTSDITQDNIEKIGKLFPAVITESQDEKGDIIKAIDFDLLRQHLSKDIVE